MTQTLSEITAALLVEAQRRESAAEAFAGAPIEEGLRRRATLDRQAAAALTAAQEEKANLALALASTGYEWRIADRERKQAEAEIVTLRQQFAAKGAELEARIAELQR